MLSPGNAPRSMRFFLDVADDDDQKWDEFVGGDNQTLGSLVMMIRHGNHLTGGKARGYDQLGSSHMAPMERECPVNGNDYDPEYL